MNKSTKRKWKETNWPGFYRRQGLTIIELVAVAALTAILVWGGVHTLSCVATQETTDRRLAFDTDQAPYIEMNGVLENRLGVAWSYNITKTTNTVLHEITDTLQLIDQTGTNYCTVTLRATGNNLTCELKDLPGYTNETSQPLDITYTYHGGSSVTQYLMNYTNSCVNWTLPSPLYVDASSTEFQGIVDTNQLSALKTGQSPMFQRTAEQYHFNPAWAGYR